MTRMHNYALHQLKRLPAMHLRLLLIAALVSTSPVHSETGNKPADTETIKYEAVELVNRLHRLEQELLYPVHTRVSVFLSVAENSRARPHSVSVEIDGSKVTDHIYTQKEIGALGSGGIQRLYTGNILMGNHKLSVRFRQLRKDGSVQTDELDYKFSKNEKAENIEIVVDNRKPHIAIQSRN